MLIVEFLQFSIKIRKVVFRFRIDEIKKWYDVPFNKNALIVNTGLALEYLSKGKFKATNHRVLWNKTKRLSIPFFFEPSYDFKMNKSFFTKRPNNNSGIIFEKFLNKSLKKFVEYQR